MLSPAEAIIYLAEQRGCTESGLHRSFHTFNFGEYHRKDRQPFGKLEVLNDDTLAGESSVSHIADEFSLMLLIPLLGKVKYAVDGVPYGSAEAGQMHLVSAPASSVVEIFNPYEKDLVNYLHVQLITGVQPPHVLVRKFGFDIDTRKNQLVHFEPESAEQFYFDPAGTNAPQGGRISIGKFDGREGTVLNLKTPSTPAFVFVIEGAFEVENRLLQTRDGLAITKTESIRLEALSNGAVVLVVE